LPIYRRHCAALNCLEGLRADSESPLLAIKKFLLPLPSDLIKAHQTRFVFANRVRPIRSFGFVVARDASPFMVNDRCTRAHEAKHGGRWPGIVSR
jgi:hypothetical protein